MRSKGFMIDASRFRHAGVFKIYSESNELVAKKTLEMSISVMFSFLSGSGLKLGEDAQLNVEGSWRQTVDNDSIVFRFNPDIHTMFLQKKLIEFEHDSKTFTCTGVLDVNGESIYSVTSLKAVA